MASTSTARPFKRISSLVRLRSRHETPYQSWEEEQADNPEVELPAPVSAGPTTKSRVVVEFPPMSAASPEPLPLDEQDRIPKPSCSTDAGESLVECFYIGSMDMTGLSIKGRGCIDTPAAKIWEHTQQQERKPKRKNSWHGSTTRHTHPTTATSSSFKPRYVKLVTGSNALKVHDNATNDLITEFPYRKISFVGTHPKHSRLFAFIAGSDASAAYCHAFKCEDEECAKQAACNLSDLFNRKIRQLLQTSSKIQVTAEASVLPTMT